MIKGVIFFCDHALDFSFPTFYFFIFIPFVRDPETPHLKLFLSLTHTDSLSLSLSLSLFLFTSLFLSPILSLSFFLSFSFLSLSHLLSPFLSLSLSISPSISDSHFLSPSLSLSFAFLSLSHLVSPFLSLIWSLPFYLSLSYLSIYLFPFLFHNPTWHNGYHLKKWTRWPDFESCTKQFTFHFILMLLRKIGIHRFSHFCYG